ncbi:MAG: CDP-alcohol phosphatidyltransferase [Desulfobacterales bacterium CG23_combo_of_CG06-09_8_20_14_all_52_9]|nr:MAG: CDP-alcohol phosphatidyltransferase [Desulfobacterales bacterium CG23_combo_of_CG06-09_8_20_14_all_52_9]
MESGSQTEAKRRTLTDWAKHASKGILEPLARLLLKLGLEPNFLSFIGFLLAVAAGSLSAVGRFPQSGCVFLLSGIIDALDGTLARIGRLESRFGAFFDSFLDRYSESALFLGIAYWSTFEARHDLVLLAILSLVGSYMVSYARARAEGVGISCRIGLFSRMERFIILVLALLSGQLFLGLVFLAIMANVTAFQRLVHVARQSRREQDLIKG